jgi:hypothetical protein
MKTVPLYIITLLAGIAIGMMLNVKSCSRQTVRIDTVMVPANIPAPPPAVAERKNLPARIEKIKSGERRAVSGEQSSIKNLQSSIGYDTALVESLTRSRDSLAELLTAAGVRVTFGFDTTIARVPGNAPDSVTVRCDEITRTASVELRYAPITTMVAVPQKTITEQSTYGLMLGIGTLVTPKLTIEYGLTVNLGILLWQK